jgi:hypothetical protein
MFASYNKIKILLINILILLFLFKTQTSLIKSTFWFFDIYLWGTILFLDQPRPQVSCSKHYCHWGNRYQAI